MDHTLSLSQIRGERADNGTDFIPFDLNSEDEVKNFFTRWGLDNETLNEPLQL